MLKFLGAIMIVVACAFLGILAAKSLEGRCILLRGLQEGLIALRREISYANTHLSRALKIASASAGQGEALFSLAAQRLSSGEGISADEAWRGAMEEFGLQKKLENEEKEILEAFGAGLGLSDTYDQINRLELCRQRLALAEGNANQKWQKLGRVWLNLGWSVGIILALLFL